MSECVCACAYVRACARARAGSDLPYFWRAFRRLNYTDITKHSISEVEWLGR